MRVTESTILANLNNNVASSTSTLQTYQNEMSTGLSINVPSDNPAGAQQAMNIQATLSNISQYLTNISSAQSFMSSTDSQLSSVNDLMTQARGIAVAAANGGTEDAATLSGYSTQISAIITQMTNLANSQFNGQQLFGGQQTSTPPYAQGDLTHAYSGDTGAISATTGAGQSMQINTPGSTIFGPIFTTLESLNADITSGNTSAISNTDLGNIDTATNSLLQTRAVIGSSLDELTSTTTQLQTAQATYQNQLSNVQDIDLAQTYSNYQAAQNVYQAALVVTSKALSLSLADYIH